MDTGVYQKYVIGHGDGYAYQYGEERNTASLKEGNNYFECDRSGEILGRRDPGYSEIEEVIRRAVKVTARLNTTNHDDEEIRDFFSELSGSQVVDSFRLIHPFDTDFGRNIKIGRGVVINHA